MNQVCGCLHTIIIANALTGTERCIKKSKESLHNGASRRLSAVFPITPEHCR
ncbi:MAG: hypothetical protein ACI4Q6_00905 [Huintestinicola sp.]